MLVGGDGHYQLSGHTETDRMDFLRLHLPGLHQALRGALDSFSSFVSYLIGDEVPTAERREAQAAEELGEVATGRPGKTVEEEAQEALESLRGSQSKGNGGLRGPEASRRHQEGSSATEQTWSWGEDSSHGSQGDRQDAGAWEAAKASRCQEPSAPFEVRRNSEAGSEAAGDRSSQTQESWENNEQEVNREETLRTWEQEEEEEVRAREPGGARGVESEWTWCREPEGKAGAGRDGRASEQSLKEAVAQEIQGAGAKEAGKEEYVVAMVRDGQSTRAQVTQEPGAESEDEAPLGRKEVRTTSDRRQAKTTLGGEEAGATSGSEETGTTSGGKEGRTTSFREDLLGVRETEYGAVPGDSIPEGTRIVCTIEEASKGAQKEEMNENREAEVRLFLKQKWALGTEGVRQEAKDQTAGKEAAEGQGSEWEAGGRYEGQADQDGKEANGRQDSEVMAPQDSLEEEVVQAEEAKEKENGQAIEAELSQDKVANEAELSQDKVANEAEGDADFEATPETRPEKEFREERSEEEAQMGREELGVEYDGPKHWVPEDWEHELIGGLQIPTEQPEGQDGKEELWNIPALSKGETEKGLENNCRNMGCAKPDISEAEAWENQRKDVERGNTQEEKVGTEEGEGKAAGGRESAPIEVLEAGREWNKVKEAGCEAESQELGGRYWVEVGTGRSLGESDARETKDEEVEATVLWEVDRTPRRDWWLEEAASNLQDSEDDTGASSLTAEIVENKAASDEGSAGTREGPVREAKEAGDEAFGRGWDSEGREEAGRGEELGAGARGTEGKDKGGQEFALGGSAEEVTGRGGQVEAFEAQKGEPGGEWVEVGESVVTEGSYGMDGFTLGSQAAGAEGTMAIVEAEGFPGGQMLLEKEVGVWQAREQGEGSEGQRGNQTPEEEAQMSCDIEDVEVTRYHREEAEKIDPEDLEDIQGQEDQSRNQDPAEAEPGPQEEAVGSAPEDAHGSWSKALLSASCLDVSVPRSRVLLSRSSLRRRSRPSFRRIPASEQQEPASPPPEEELSTPEQRPLQPEGPPEPSPTCPEGTPVPARRSPLGHGFGLAHSGMMQELQARLGRPKPQ
ncbi:apolipoprotein B receptor isoform X2 [Phyllostomus hastatus]|uniref:apolipoprotein B receptor isoform X2 n=1 Tax=Phyllostomus hastatus TaxID=9423 RepID=UPI001E67E789|nr:apolipoprotein B receptor isoform X2 [Phyllostomus hastatus]